MKLRAFQGFFKWVALSGTLVFCLNSTAWSFDHSHTALTQILSKIVLPSKNSTKVDYSQIFNRPEALNQYLRTLSAVKKSEFKSWNEKQRLAFLINVYNAFTLQLIILNYPVKSIKKIGFLGIGRLKSTLKMMARDDF